MLFKKKKTAEQIIYLILRNKYGSSDPCSAPPTTRRLFSKVHLPPTSAPTRARPLFFVFFAFTSSLYDCKKLGNSDLQVKASPLFPSRAKHTGSMNCGWRRRVKAGIANSLSVRCAGVCPFARTDVRMRKQWATWWAKKRAPFQKKGGGRREKRGRFVRMSTSFHSFSPYSRKIFDCSKLNSCFCAW